MTTAREIMHGGAECIGMDDTLAQAARRMRDLHVGAMPICGDDDRLHGILTDRDIVVKCIADGGNPEEYTAGSFAQGAPVWVEANAEHEEVLQVLSEHKLRRVPVIENHRLIGIISEADVATRLDESEIANFTRSIYAAPANS